jgi:hypothetical protein
MIEPGARIALEAATGLRRPHIRQIELCDRLARAVIARERSRGLEVFGRRDWR